MRVGESVGEAPCKISEMMTRACWDLDPLGGSSLKSCKLSSVQKAVECIMEILSRLCNTALEGIFDGSRG